MFIEVGLEWQAIWVVRWIVRWAGIWEVRPSADCEGTEETGAITTTRVIPWEQKSSHRAPVRTRILSVSIYMRIFTFIKVLLATCLLCPNKAIKSFQLVD